MRQVLTPTPDPSWVIEENGYDPLRECSSEARFAVGNGFLGVRGARSVSRGPMWLSWMHALQWASWPRTYVAGLFEIPNIEPPVPALLPAPDWLRVHIHVHDELLVLRAANLVMHRRALDLRRAVLITEWEQNHPRAGLIRVRTLRLVSQADRALGMQLLTLDVERAGIAVTIEAEVTQTGLGVETVQLHHESGLWRSEVSGKSLAMAGHAALRVDDTDLPPGSPTPLIWRWHWTSAPGGCVALWRLVAFARGDERGADPGAAASAALSRALESGWPAVLAAHERAWAERWQCSDFEIEGDAEAQRALRFAIYHLNSAANPLDEHVSIGARALTGDAYLGHVFWDTEIYLLPFFTLTWPEAARSLLMYRYHTLNGARAKAARMGWRGALYAWESADTGEETTPVHVMGFDGRPVDVLCGIQEQHISADIAYAVWQYWQATQDESFLRAAGAEILLETARFWASRVELGPDGRGHIRGVIGPDEYHETIDDNAYTNVLARWNIRRGLDAAALLEECWPQDWAALSSRLVLNAAEMQQWKRAADSLVTGFDPETGLYEQFTGYYGLENVPLAGFAGRTVAMDVALGRERIKQSQILKQADVVALLALLPDEFDAKTQAANFAFYEPRCSHDSSLSRPMHAVVAARLGETERTLQYFREVAAMDLADTGGVSAGGVHIAALGGLWQVAVLGFAGVSVHGEMLSLAPRIPPAWGRVAFRLHWRGRQIRFQIEDRGALVRATVEAGEGLAIAVHGAAHELAPGVERVIAGFQTDAKSR